MGARAWAALATVYLVWGSTYLGIKVAIRTLPPLLMPSARFVAAGLVLTLLAARGAARPTLRQWAAAALAGTAMLAAGNGGITWAEQRVDSGVAALLVATMPLWLALLDRLVNGRRLGPATIAGLLAGLGGVAILVAPGGGHVDAVGALVCVAAALSWAAGSLYAQRASQPQRPLLAAGMQMLGGGVVLAVAGLAAGEASSLHPASVSAASLGALAYLAVIGSLVAFSAYAWLLRSAPTALVSTYAYVNPVVAVLLGAAFLHERLGLRTLVAGLAIVGSVVLIVSAQTAGRAGRAEPAPPGELREEGARLAA